MAHTKYKTSLTVDHGLKIKASVYQFLDEKLEKILWPWVGHRLLRYDTKVWHIKSKLMIWVLSQLKMPFLEQTLRKKRRTQTTDERKSKHALENKCVPTIHKDISKFNNNNNSGTPPSPSVSQWFEQKCHQRQTTMANKHMERCSVSWVTGQCSRTTVRRYHTSAGITMVRKPAPPSVVGVGKWKLSYTKTRSLQSYRHFWEGFGNFWKS